MNVAYLIDTDWAIDTFSHRLTSDNRSYTITD
jgi:hypothetical protein